MKLIKCLKHALNMVFHSKLRSWLTIIGIVIGVASVIAIVSFGDGMEAEINDQMGDLGDDIITISPGYSKASSGGFRKFPGADSSSSSSDDDVLDKKDYQTLRIIPGLEYIDTRISGSVDIYYLSKSGSVTLTGVNQKVWSNIVTDDLDEGRYLDSADSNVVVIGYSLAHDYFDKELGINKAIIIEGKSYRIVGILEDGTRNSIYMPIEAAYDVIEDSVQNEYDSIVVQVSADENVSLIAEMIEEKLRLSRHVNVKEQDFTVSTNIQMSSMRSEMTSTMTSFLTAIAAISLIVGAVGVANTMFTSVLEKTKQIGIMKAIGAKNGDILTIFILNAAVIGLIGGIVGVIIGYGLAYALTLAGMNAIVTFQTVSVAMGVSLLVGLISGLIPAYQASQLNPVDALRYE